jgi:signal transduction histidine kinase
MGEIPGGSPDPMKAKPSERSNSGSSYADDSDTSESDANKRVEHLIEELRKRTAELEEANRELRGISHYRSLFLARMSHELRTPLTSILGFSEILLDQEPLTDSQRRFCEKIQSSGLQLQTSLNQLVDLSRLEAGQTELFLQEFSLRDTLRESCAVLSRFSQKHQVTIQCEVGANVGNVVSDQGKFRQVLYNFLAWAVSRSPSGEVVRLYAQLDDPAILSMRIDDSGEAILDLTQVFEPEESPNSKAGDAKLGIIVGRRLLDLMNGQVNLENRDDGLRVTIQLPARPKG